MYNATAASLLPGHSFCVDENADDWHEVARVDLNPELGTVTVIDTKGRGINLDAGAQVLIDPDFEGWEVEPA